MIYVWELQDASGVIYLHLSGLYECIIPEEAFHSKSEATAGLTSVNISETKSIKLIPIKTGAVIAHDPRKLILD